MYTRQSKTFLMVLVAATLMVVGCSSKKETSAEITQKQTALAKLKSEKQKNEEEITRLQKELQGLDGAPMDRSKIKLVSIAPVLSSAFEHFIELQGKVDAENSSYISPRNGGGQVKQVFVKQGQRVRKGQLLLKMDDQIQRQAVIAARQQSAGIRTQLTLAKSIYERQKNLWDKGIGTEVQLLQARTNVTSLENQLSLVAENVKLAEAQLNTANVYSDVNGVADVVNIRPGEIFVGMTALGAQIKIVNTSSLKVVSSIPENYMGAVQVGSAAIVQMPDIGRIYNGSVSYIGASIDLLNRGFNVEVRLPSDAALKPNQLALVKIRDYAAANAISIPLKTLQDDQEGKFVIIASTEAGKLIARKRPVTVGMINGSNIEIKSGLKGGEQLVTEGYNGLYEGQEIKTNL